MNVGGDPYVIEYNVRMGDPETEVVFPRITSDTVDMFEAMVAGTLDRYVLTVSPLCATTVVAVSGGYPGDYKKGFPISGLDNADTPGDTTIFHAGTCRAGDKVVTAGGRVLAVTSLAPTMRQALAASYSALDKISFEGICYRKDIGSDLTPQSSLKT
jgi:phosphoribosylamine--glycine ligase